MKIAYVIPDLETKGGIQNFAKTIAENIKTQHTVDYYKYEYYPFQKYNKILYLFPAFVGAYLYRYIFSHHYKKQYNFKNYDLIHFWHIDAAMAFTNKNYIVTCHGLEILPIQLIKYRKILYKEVLMKAKSITADSTYTKELLIKNFGIPKSKIVVIYPCVNTSQFDKPHKKSKNLVIGSLSRFVERKNFLNIIKALEYLHTDYKREFIFNIAGTGPEKERILQLLKTVSYKWKYLGEISDKEKINNFYPKLDIFVMPTLDLANSIEGFGIVYIEANSAGVPVIASPVGGVVDAVKDGTSGLFCNPTQPKDIAKKINTLINRTTMYKKNLKRWVIQFDTATIAKQFLNVYSSKK